MINVSARDSKFRNGKASLQSNCNPLSNDFDEIFLAFFNCLSGCDYMKFNSYRELARRNLRRPIVLAFWMHRISSYCFCSGYRAWVLRGEELGSLNAGEARKLGSRWLNGIEAFALQGA
jgi:hypothetical protein